MLEVEIDDVDIDTLNKQVRTQTQTDETHRHRMTNSLAHLQDQAPRGARCEQPARRCVEEAQRLDLEPGSNKKQKLIL